MKYNIAFRILHLLPLALRAFRRKSPKYFWCPYCRQWIEAKYQSQNP